MRSFVLPLYLEWHYRDKLLDFFQSWKNLLRFGKEYFSIFFLLRTLFSYWRNYHEYYKKGFELKYNFSVFTFNAISRIIGAFVRIWVILAGIIFEILIFIGGIIFIIIWILFPLIIIGIFIFGIKIII